MARDFAGGKWIFSRIFQAPFGTGASLILCRIAGRRMMVLCRDSFAAHGGRTPWNGLPYHRRRRLRSPGIRTLQRNGDAPGWDPRSDLRNRSPSGGRRRLRGMAVAHRLAFPRSSEPPGKGAGGGPGSLPDCTLRGLQRPRRRGLRRTSQWAPTMEPAIVL
jgi:hypothetical protein